MLKSFRYLLLPFSILYGLVIIIRNWLFDKNIFKSFDFNFPIICVGNLSIGGTGKTPMVEYLIVLLDQQYKIATLSRGYKRKTRGFGIANENTTALEIGDEPMQFHQKFPGTTVAVGEERLVAIPQLLDEAPGIEVIILDDAFQHRPVKAGLNIVLTECSNLYSSDLFMPAGDLRDSRRSANRADIIVVTKCKSNLSTKERTDIIEELSPNDEQSLFFTTLEYTQPYHLFSRKPMALTSKMELLLVCGIANPTPLQEYLASKVQGYDMLRFPDHHIFSIDDMDDIKKQFDAIDASNKIIITTEKDAVRLQKFENKIQELPIYVLPIRHSFLFNDADRFGNMVLNFVASFESRVTEHKL